MAKAKKKGKKGKKAKAAKKTKTAEGRTVRADGFRAKVDFALPLVKKGMERKKIVRMLCKKFPGLREDYASTSIIQACRRELGLVGKPAKSSKSKAKAAAKSSKKKARKAEKAKAKKKSKAVVEDDDDDEDWDEEDE